MSHEFYAPDGRYSSQRQNPLEREAAYIAQQMDSGNAELAGQRLRQDLYQLQHYPEQATQLVQLVQQFDRKGSGADLEIRQGRQNGYSVADASIVDYDYYRDRYSGRVQRQPFNVDRICTILLPQNGRNYSYNGHHPSQSYYAPFDPRASYDPRGTFDPYDSINPTSSYYSQNSVNRGSHYRNQSSQFDPRNPANWGPEEAWRANQGYHSGAMEQDLQAWQNEQDGYTGYQPDWQRFNPEPSAYLPRNFDYAQQQDQWQHRQPNRNAHRLPRHNQGHNHGHNPHASANVRAEGMDQDAAFALQRAQQMAARDGVNIQVTSGFRTYAEQSRLYAKLNGISPVAKPGTSSHEHGEAIDVKNYAQAKPYLLAAGFVHGDGRGKIAGDPWHFRYMG